MNFWSELAKPFFALAPMEAVTDVVFRETIWHAGEIATRDNGGELLDNEPQLMLTEFTNVTSFASADGEFSTRGRLTFAPDEISRNAAGKPDFSRNLVAQIWGAKPADFREMSRQMLEKGFSGVDVNMGCPDKSIIKTHAGSGLIENPELASEILRATQNGFYDYYREQNSEFAKLTDDEMHQKLPTWQIPVSVKTRLGAHRVDEFRQWLPVLFNEHPANLTIHVRTRKEMSKVPAHYELLPEILRLRDEIAPQTLLTLNGDIASTSDALALRERYARRTATGQLSRIDGFMVGRGVFNNPFVFTNIATPTRAQLFELLRFQLAKYDEFREIGQWQGQILTRQFAPLKHFFKIYTNGFNGAKKLREQMMKAETTDEVREILDEFETAENR